MKKQAVVLALCLIVSASYAEAQNSMSLMVDSVRKYFKAEEKPIQGITVINTDPKGRSFLVTLKLFERVKQREDHTWEEKEVKDALMIAPKRFVLKSGEKRIVRAVNVKGPGTKEKTYRLAFYTKTYTENAPWDNEKAENVSMGVTMVVVPAVVLQVAPAVPNPKVVWERTEKGITFENKGNIEVELRRTGRYCASEEMCVSLPGIRLYPGHKWHFDIAGHIPLKWEYKVYDQIVGKPFDIKAFGE